MILDGTGMELIPGNGGKDCPGNGTRGECCCDECDYLMCCFDETQPLVCEECDDERCPRSAK